MERDQHPAGSHLSTLARLFCNIPLQRTPTQEPSRTDATPHLTIIEACSLTRYVPSSYIKLAHFNRSPFSFLSSISFLEVAEQASKQARKSTCYHLQLQRAQSDTKTPDDAANWPGEGYHTTITKQY